MKKELKTEISRDKIVRSAIDEFGANGYRQGALNNICKNGISKGVIYHNFANKDELYLVALKRSFDEFMRYIREENVGLDLDKYLAARIDFIKTNVNISRMILAGIIRPPVHLREKIKEIKSEYTELNNKIYLNLLRGIELRDGVSEEGALEYFDIMQGMFNGYFANMAFNKDGGEIAEEHERILPMALDYMIHGIVKQK